MNFIRKMKNVFNAVRLAKRFYKNGGSVIANIAYPQYGDVLKNKRVLITGGGSGIGLAIAKKYAQCGANVLITGRNEEKLQSAIVEIGKNANYICWDICDIHKCQKQLEEASKLLGGPVDILVNNAGVAPSKFWGNVDEAEWDKVYGTNLKGMFFLTQQIVKNWGNYVANGYRKIINISSQGGFVGATYPYRMVKWDVRGLTEGLGKSLIKDNIIVNAIAPGVVRTSMQEFSLNQGDNLYTNQNPVQRVCLPEEIAELALFLASDASNFIIGQTIVCDGGYTLK